MAKGLKNGMTLLILLFAAVAFPAGVTLWALKQEACESGESSFADKSGTTAAVRAACPLEHQHLTGRARP